MKERDLTIDCLRFVGLSLIIIAHVQAPYNLTQIRCFDVPMMLFISGLTSAGRSTGNYTEYIVKRTKRLIVPVWMFLFFYLSVFYFAQSIVLSEKYLTWDMIWRSFLLLDKSIGYVWIIRVFLLVMLVTPPLLWFTKNYSKIHHALGLATVLCGLLVLVNGIIDNIENEGLCMVLIRDIVQYTVAYSIPFVLGLYIKGMGKRQELLFIVFLAILSIVPFYYYTQTNSFPEGLAEKYKFPPQVYYITYGSLMSAALWSLRPIWKYVTKIKAIVFIGQNTIWIYLWHMPFALFATVFMHNWIIKYFLVYGMAITCFGIQYLIVSRMSNKTITKYLIG